MTTPSVKTKSTIAADTLGPSMSDRILNVIDAHKSRSITWHELQKAIGPKANGDLFIQLDSLGTRDHNIKVWYGVSKEFHDAIQKLRDDQRIRLFGVSPVGYFPAATTPPIPITHDYKIAHSSPHLFLTCVEIVP